MTPYSGLSGIVIVHHRRASGLVVVAFPGFLSAIGDVDKRIQSVCDYCVPMIARVPN